VTSYAKDFFYTWFIPSLVWRPACSSLHIVLTKRCPVIILVLIYSCIEAGILFCSVYCSSVISKLNSIKPVVPIWYFYIFYRLHLNAVCVKLRIKCITKHKIVIYVIKVFFVSYCQLIYIFSIYVYIGSIQRVFRSLLFYVIYYFYL